MHQHAPPRLRVFISTLWTLIALAPAIGAVWLVRRLVRLMADLPDNLVDERVRAVRNQRYVEAYRLLSAIIVTILFTLAPTRRSSTGSLRLATSTRCSGW